MCARSDALSGLAPFAGPASAPADPSAPCRQPTLPARPSTVAVLVADKATAAGTGTEARRPL